MKIEPPGGAGPDFRGPGGPGSIFWGPGGPGGPGGRVGTARGLVIFFFFGIRGSMGGPWGPPWAPPWGPPWGTPWGTRD